MKHDRQVFGCAQQEKFPKSLDGIQELRCAGIRQFQYLRLEAENFSRPMTVSPQPLQQFIHADIVGWTKPHTLFSRKPFVKSNKAGGSPRKIQGRCSQQHNIARKKAEARE